MENFNKVNSTNCTIVGFGYFVARPHLWLGPLVATLISFFILTGTFFLVTYFSWPSENLRWFAYTWGIFKSFGYASVAILCLWVSLFPIILNLAFEQMCGRILHIERSETKGEGLAQALASSIYVIFRTLGWRIFWPLITLVSLFFFGPLTLFLAQVGMGHIAIIDACDLSLSIQGVKGGDRMKLMKKRRWLMLMAGLIGGMLSMVLTITIIGWLFWLPGVYAGATLWTMNWKQD